MTGMTIHLQAITKDNYEDICDLDVTVEQQDYVASNMWSIVQSKFHDEYQTRAIYRDEQPVGFFMWVPHSRSVISIWRFMVDQRYQKSGIGRAALNLALNEIKTSDKVKEIEICYDPENPVAKGFYSSFGFQEVGLDEDGEDMLAVIKL